MIKLKNIITFFKKHLKKTIIKQGDNIRRLPC